jgi:hypothetical protein
MEKTMVEERDGNDKDDQTDREVSDRQMLLRIVELASTDDLPDEALSEMVEALERIVTAHKQKQS